MHEITSVAADLGSLDSETLAALVLAQQEKLLSRDSEIEHLKLIIAKLRRMMFGTKSEKITREIEQLELKLEELEVREAERAESRPGSKPPSKRAIATASTRAPSAGSACAYACRRHVHCMW
jgi:hypothetical protein